MSALSWDTSNHLTVPRLDQDCQEELTCRPRTLPNGQRISGERRGEADERVRWTRVLGRIGLNVLMRTRSGRLQQTDYRRNDHRREKKL